MYLGDDFEGEVGVGGNCGDTGAAAGGLGDDDEPVFTGELEGAEGREGETALAEGDSAAAAGAGGIGCGT